MNYPRLEQKPFKLGIRGQLMLFLCAMSAFILLLVWALTSYFLQWQYNQYIRAQLTSQADALVAMINASESPISARSFWGLQLDPVFWERVNTAVNDGTLDVTNCCVEVSDTTLGSVNYIENLYPCLIHAPRSQLGRAVSTERDSALALKLRKSLFENGTLYDIVRTSSNSSQMVVGRLTADRQYAVIFSTNLQQIGEAGAVLGHLLPFIMAFVLLVSLAGSYLFSRWFARPITDLSRAARQMAGGDYTTRVHAGSRNELGQLAEDFNQMANEVQQASQMQKDLLANVSHDLRTPLTLIKGYAETVRDITGNDPERRARQLGIIVDESDRLSGLVNSVMEMSKLTSGAEKPAPVRFDMAALCSEVSECYRALCAQNGWTLVLEADAECPVEADPAMMERVLHNLLGNATHHLGEDGVFILRAIPLPDGCRVEVADHGPGIRPEDMPHLFDRYYRSRSDSGKPGTGLGLSITKAILENHGFAYGAESTPGQGATFWFEARSGQSKNQ